LDAKDLDAIHERVLDAVDEATGEHEIPTVEERLRSHTSWTTICGLALTAIGLLVAAVVYVVRVDERVRFVEDKQDAAVSRAQFDEFRGAVLRDVTSTAAAVDELRKRIDDNSDKLDAILGAVRKGGR
jgi:acetaldehyde dehydrogenase (acetylating)